MRAVTLRQPWAWLVSRRIKRIENRKWRPKELGWIAIHAGHGLDVDDIPSIRARLEPDELRAFDEAIAAGFSKGCIVAIVHVERVIEDARDAPDGQQKWFSGPLGWVLDQVIPLEPIPCRGGLGLWTVPAHLNLGPFLPSQRNER